MPKARRKAAGARTANAKTAKPEPAAAPARPKRPKKTLGDDFAAALRADFRAHGAGVIAAVRAEKPDQYLKVVLTMLPKDFSESLDASENSLDRLSDEEIRSRIRGLEASLRPFLDSGADVSGAARGTRPKAAP
ncbi:hypothetical protein EN836_26610 [Mesorhizobium sp. M1C.F.Ca.ET.193.01.1.1]|nr:hypothetical protein EN853_26605 [Mesorhizobium sp. M1C.F.Ca.ET.210.01.1.1]TGQ66437.1 hypothetical protein EN855_026615 [Mesorhizobium sp. M1C.F.Ca.ET.212.01.1.1]TGR00523.1 hypothetical protein EN847_26605 [Mesorhizobium sp. M1C.F.Ca.ET.204.01.1.1]TGR21114.1 hypothetical protein EN839_26605 [Mesorhizobium sp. M1C.F.Ca.ET.196.01.1.1]TGR43832.1 hypothetical protein EN838_26605 [Mesorhizobium sp. M1C.F.Ca.ET.195.01.1.1]TGR61973.1 hypothetical protein EN835_026600 [Mesorhizobium sp. M1C.F.Ca.ET